MHLNLKPLARSLPLGCLLAVGLLLQGCLTPYESRHENQWDAREQIWMSEASQVKLRAAQSRIFDMTDRRTILKAILSTMQDLNFQLEVLDEELGIVSGKYFAPLERPEYGYDPLYHLYEDQSLLVFSKTYLSWGPFWHRNDVVRPREPIITPPAAVPDIRFLACNQACP